MWILRLRYFFHKITNTNLYYLGKIKMCRTCNSCDAAHTIEKCIKNIKQKKTIEQIRKRFDAAIECNVCHWYSEPGYNHSREECASNIEERERQRQERHYYD